MKRLMLAALAATLMSGTAAFAQDQGNVVSNAPAGQPPSDYPPCTHKGQDRCVARAGLSEHAKVHHHKKSKA